MVARLCSAYVNDRREARGENVTGLQSGVYSDDGGRSTLVGRDEVRALIHNSTLCATVL